MRFFKIVPTIIMLFILFSSYKTADNDPLKARMTTDNFTFTIDKPINGNVTKAIMYNGEIIPFIELPTIEITAKRNTEHFQRAIVVDGKIYPSVTLDEVIIKPNL